VRLGGRIDGRRGIELGCVVTLIVVSVPPTADAAGTRRAEYERK
jgi:hypothetical protein